QAFECSRKGGRRGIDGEGRAVDAAKLLDAGIDMYERLLRPGDVDEGVALGGHFAEPAANQDDEIGVLYARKEVWVRSDAEVAGVAGMLRIEEMRPAERGRDRQRKALGEALDCHAGRRRPAAAAEERDRTLRLVKHRLQATHVSGARRRLDRRERRRIGCDHA